MALTCKPVGSIATSPILRSSALRNGFNEPVETFRPFRTAWANKRDASASESYRAAEVGAEITTGFTIRWSSEVANVDPRDRVLFDGVEYNMTAVRAIARNRWREIDAVARAERMAETPAG